MSGRICGTKVPCLADLCQECCPSPWPDRGRGQYIYVNYLGTNHVRSWCGDYDQGTSRPRLRGPISSHPGSDAVAQTAVRCIARTQLAVAEGPFEDDEGISSHFDKTALSGQPVSKRIGATKVDLHTSIVKLARAVQVHQAQILYDKAQGWHCRCRVHETSSARTGTSFAERANQGSVHTRASLG